MTILEGFDSGTDLKALSKELKRMFACGGTVKGNTIELQGEHKIRVKEALVSMGYAEDQIDVK
jgi:translation initiation factor 1